MTLFLDASVKEEAPLGALTTPPLPLSPLPFGSIMSVHA